MALSAKQLSKIRGLAQELGLSPADLIAEAEGLASQTKPDSPSSDSTGDAPSDGKPIFERLLIGAFPFIRVRELRQNWLGLTERVPDDEMMCGEFAAKHGGGQPGPAAPASDTTE